MSFFNISRLAGFGRFFSSLGSGLIPSPPPVAENQKTYEYTLPEGAEESPVTWSVTAGSLPAGVSLVNGVVSGTPTVTGSFQATLTGQQTVILTFNVTPAIPTIIAPDLSNLTDEDTLNLTFSASNGVAPYTWAVTSGTLPTGLSLASNGDLTGTITEAGSFNFIVTVTGDDTGARSQVFSLNVAVLPLEITTTSLPAANGGTAYSENIVAAGGITPYTFSLTDGGLPSGLSFASNGTLSGTPVESGAFNFTVTVTDSQSLSDSQALSIDVNVDPLDITTTSLGVAQLDEAFSTTISATGGIAPYTFAVTAGSLPTGLSLASDGTISGTPTVEETANFTVTVTDIEGTTDAQALSLSVASTVELVDTTSLSALGPTRLWKPDTATMNTAVDGTGGSPSESGSVGQWVDSIAGAVLTTSAQNGTVTLDDVGVRFVRDAFMEEVGSAGLYNYLHNTVGTYVVWLRRNVGTYPGASITYISTRTGTSPGIDNGQTGLVSWAANIRGSFLTGDGYPDPGVGNIFSLSTDFYGTDQSVGVGLRYYRAWLDGASALPDAIASFSTSDHQSNFQVSRGGNLNVNSALVDHTIVAIAFFDRQLSAAEIASAVPPEPLDITTTSLNTALLNETYSGSLEATGGVTPYTWAITSGALPTGLSLTSDGTISGTPTVEETTNFTVTVTDAFGNSDVQELTLAVSAVQPLLWDSSSLTTSPASTWTSLDGNDTLGILSGGTIVDGHLTAEIIDFPPELLSKLFVSPALGDGAGFLMRIQAAPGNLIYFNPDPFFLQLWNDELSLYYVNETPEIIGRRLTKSYTSAPYNSQLYTVGFSIEGVAGGTKVDLWTEAGLEDTVTIDLSNVRTHDGSAWLHNDPFTIQKVQIFDRPITAQDVTDFSAV